MEHHSDMVNIEHNESDVYLYDISSTEILLGKRLERERIIALLEQEASANDDVKNPYDAEYIRALIGIIRGETA